MSDTTYAPSQSAANEGLNTSSHGSFIWYELLTPDPKGSKAFYDAVVGWNIEAEPSGEMDYRMIGRADGGNAGGVMRLTDEMRTHGARPVWLGYVAVDDVDARVTKAKKAGGTLMRPIWSTGAIGAPAKCWPASRSSSA